MPSILPPESGATRFRVRTKRIFDARRTSINRENAIVVIGHVHLRFLLHFSLGLENAKDEVIPTNFTPETPCQPLHPGDEFRALF